jgi:3-mercaptopyruvate sulfurtransferase SseA
MMRLIFSIFAIGVLGLAVLTACNSADKTNPKGSAAATTPAAPHPDGVRRVSVNELRDMLARNEAVVVDVRTEDAYKTAHIKGAKLIPVGEILNHTGELPKDKLIVTYCS